MIYIGLIDSGININSPLIVDRRVIMKGWKGMCADFHDTLGHGTQCAHIIQKMVDNKDYNIYNIKIFEDRLKASSKVVLEAIQWCIDNNIKIINLSLSITDINYYYEFKRICDVACKQGVIIVAAADNAGRVCLPAYLENVFGVGIANNKDQSDFYYCTNSQIQLYLNGHLQNTINELNGISATSYATARMTGIFTKILQKKPSMDFNKLKTTLLNTCIPYSKENIPIVNEKINLKKCTVPVLLNNENNLKLIKNQLRRINPCHITKDQILSIALINLTIDHNTLEIEAIIKDKLTKQRHEIVQITSYNKSNTLDLVYSFAYYKQIPEKLHSTYAKALIETVNNNHPNAELIMIGINKPIIPLSFSNTNYFDNYTLSELSLIFGFQVDFYVLIVNELTEFNYIQRNIDCLKSIFGNHVIFLIYNSLYQRAINNNTIQYMPNPKFVRDLSENYFLKLQNELKNKLNINLYDINNEEQSNNICNSIIELL